MAICNLTLGAEVEGNMITNRSSSFDVVMNVQLDLFENETHLTHF